MLRLLSLLRRPRISLPIPSIRQIRYKIDPLRSVGFSGFYERYQIKEMEHKHNRQPEKNLPKYSWQHISPDARLVYVTDLETAEKELAALSPGPLGFDLEWKPNYVKGERENPVALIQLASRDVILLIHLAHIQEIPRTLVEVLQDHRFLKVGAGIQGDCKKLWKDWSLAVHNCVDLSLLARSVDNDRWKGSYSNPIGLARMCEMYVEMTLTKGRITTSNWEMSLTQPQIAYAANDSHSGLSIYLALMELALKLTTPLEPAYYSFDSSHGIHYHPQSTELWRPHNPYYDPGPPPPPKEPKDTVLPPQHHQRGDAMIAASTSFIPHGFNPSTSALAGTAYPPTTRSYYTRNYNPQYKNQRGPQQSMHPPPPPFPLPQQQYVSQQSYSPYGYTSSQSVSRGGHGRRNFHHDYSNPRSLEQDVQHEHGNRGGYRGRGRGKFRAPPRELKEYN
ncbi:hypothetical protein ABKN59_009943 [Abortiporus biennis]